MTKLVNLQVLGDNRSRARQRVRRTQERRGTLVRGRKECLEFEHALISASAKQLKIVFRTFAMSSPRHRVLFHPIHHPFPALTSRQETVSCRAHPNVDAPIRCADSGSPRDAAPSGAGRERGRVKVLLFIVACKLVVALAVGRGLEIARGALCIAEEVVPIEARLTDQRRLPCVDPGEADEARHGEELQNVGALGRSERSSFAERMGLVRRAARQPSRTSALGYASEIFSRV